MPRPSWTAETFWNKVKRGNPNECWEWQGRLNNTGRPGNCFYGRVDIFGKQGIYVHRVAYYISFPGQIELGRGNGLLVCHTCDNPKCCNPKHLFLGTAQDNVDDKVKKGRQKHYKSTESPRAKLSEKDVRDIRAARKKGIPRKELAKKYGVHITAIKCVVSRRHYKDII